MRPEGKFYNGAEPVRPKSIRRFEQRFVAYGFVPGSIYPVYGMSETTLIVSAPDIRVPEITRTIEGMDVPSVGYPLGDFRIRIRDEAGSDLPRNAIGEILIQGTTVTPGYLDEAANAESLEDGWLATGDLGLLDEDGRLDITGRKKDLIIHQGRNFYGHDIAASIAELPEAKVGHTYVFSVDVDGVDQGLTQQVITSSGMLQNWAKTVYAHPVETLGSALKRATARAIAVGEVNACMGRIAAAPTAGSAGIMPAALVTMMEEHGISERGSWTPFWSPPPSGSSSPATPRSRAPRRDAWGRRGAPRLWRQRRSPTCWAGPTPRSWRPCPSP